MSMTNFRAEDMMKVSHAKDSQKGQDKSGSEQSTQPPQDQGHADQATGQQSGQESGEPTTQTSEAEGELQRDEAEEDEGESDDSEPVPEGTTAEILRWVGNDQGRAQRALDKEQAEEKPRTGLTGELKQILE
jgi:hypothetical protein